MAYDLGHRHVIGVCSSAVFDLTGSNAVFKSQGEEEYRKFHEFQSQKRHAAAQSWPLKGISCQDGENSIRGRKV
ncbi:5'-nucleotidase [Sodalis sp. RH20]|uniref:5'-nucleotidase n=1 Tax=Sodalis sp. RH20 TaxID=3394335 RepID=UPI0039B470AB